MSDTREKIISCSLELFAVEGTKSVSIRDICAQVGIKESSVYYHFKNKQAIIDELYARFERRAMELMAELDSALASGAKAERGFFLNVCAKYFDSYLCDAFCNRVLRLLTIEQLSDRPARALYRRWLFDEPLSYQTRVFAALTGRSDASYLAVQFYAPIYLYAQRWLLTGTLSEGDKAAFRADAYRHVRKFFSSLTARL